MRAARDADSRNAALLLRDQCRYAKEQLSHATTTTITATALPPELPDSEVVGVTRVKLEALIEVLVTEAADLLARVRDESGVTPDEVYMIGGSCFIPSLRAAVADRAGMRPAERGKPHLAVALGAAHWAHQQTWAAETPVEPAPQPSPEPGELEPEPSPGQPGTGRRKAWWIAARAAALIGAVVVIATQTGGSGVSDAGSGSSSTPTYTCSDGSIVSYAYQCPTSSTDPAPAPASDGDSIATAGVGARFTCTPMEDRRVFASSDVPDVDGAISCTDLYSEDGVGEVQAWHFSSTAGNDAVASTLAGFSMESGYPFDLTGTDLDGNSSGGSIWAYDTSEGYGEMVVSWPGDGLVIFIPSGTPMTVSQLLTQLSGQRLAVGHILEPTTG